MAYLLQGNKDCAIVSICNYTGKSYEEVLDAAEIVTPGFRNILGVTRGTYEHEITFILAYLTKRAWYQRLPRRGQERINGLISWHRPNYRHGHMTACIQGNVFDTDGQVISINEYKRRTGFVIRQVWS